jgi:pyruvate dehydrogenase E1 component alpha subunit
MPRNVVNEFSVEHVQILDKDGNIDEDLDPDLDDEELYELLYHMKRGRLLDERALKLSYGGRLGIFAPAKGQEAAQVGTAYALSEQDWMFPSYRDHLAGIVRGMDLEYSLLYWGGDERGIDYGYAHNVFPIAIPVGSQPLHAVGHAKANQMDDKDGVAVTFFGDGATSTGDTQEAMNFAGAWDAPVLFLCQNNQYGISVPREKQTGAETIAQKAVSYGFEGVQVDGNDALAVYQEVKRALKKARDGGGPTLIEAETFRRGPHTTPDDPGRYRSDEEVEKWKERDPIKRFEAYMKSEDLLDDDELEDLEEEIKEEVDEAIFRYENIPEKDPIFFFDQIYEEKPWHLEEQQQQLLDEIEE